MPSLRSQRGTQGEGIACRYLEAQGYSILARNFRCPHGEVDIIALDETGLVFVEVRIRRTPGSYGTPQESLSSGKRSRLVATAEAYIQSCSNPPEEWRIDLIAISMPAGGSAAEVDHIQNAIEL